MLGEGGVFLDVGAHIGYFSMKAALKVGPTGRVVAFEPNPETLELLRGNVIANQARNVAVQPVACTDKERTLTLYASPIENSGASSLSRDNADISTAAATRAYTTRGRPIDDVVQELNLTRVDAIKIDVEGAEPAVLRGALQTLKRFHPRVVLEVIPSQLASFNATPDDLASLLKEAGYDRSRPLNPEKADWEWTAPREHSFQSTVRVADPQAADQLLRGFHAAEANAWCWTDARFAAALRVPPGAARAGARLVLKLAFLKSLSKNWAPSPYRPPSPAGPSRPKPSPPPATASTAATSLLQLWARRWSKPASRARQVPASGRRGRHPTGRHPHLHRPGSPLAPEPMV